MLAEDSGFARALWAGRDREEGSQDCLLHGFAVCTAYMLPAEPLRVTAGGMGRHLDRYQTSADRYDQGDVTLPDACTCLCVNVVYQRNSQGFIIIPAELPKPLKSRSFNVCNIILLLLKYHLG